MREVVEIDDVEVLQFLEKYVVDGKGDQAQPRVRHIDAIGRCAQEDKGHQFDQRILLHRHA